LQLKKAFQLIAARGSGVIVYLNQEGRDIGLTDKIKSYALQDKGYDTVEANIALGYKPDMRAYHIGTQILRDLGILKMELLTNNPGKIAGLEHYGLEIVRRVPLQTELTRGNKKYLSTKRDKLGHLLH
jgi:3,4-dihydroxy 2-butanone 4-phosphate synthase/GTP cyclohydrolase II